VVLVSQHTDGLTYLFADRRNILIVFFRLHRTLPPTFNYSSAHRSEFLLHDAGDSVKALIAVDVYVLRRRRVGSAQSEKSVLTWRQTNARQMKIYANHYHHHHQHQQQQSERRIAVWRLNRSSRQMLLTAARTSQHVILISKYLNARDIAFAANRINELKV